MKKVIVAWMVGVFLASVAWAGQAADSGPQTGEGGKGQTPRPEFPQAVIAIHGVKNNAASRFKIPCVYAPSSTDHAVLDETPCITRC